MPSLVRPAGNSDFAAIKRLYAQLQPEDPPIDNRFGFELFEQILQRPGLELLVLDHAPDASDRNTVAAGSSTVAAGSSTVAAGSSIAATAYLNIIPNLTRSNRPYAVIENVVVEEALRGTGLGRKLMDATLERAWAAGCYKAMLMTGSSDPSTHAFYRASGFSADAKTAYLARPPDDH